MKIRSIVIFNRELKIEEVRMLKKQFQIKTFRRLKAICYEVCLASRSILGRPVSFDSTAYEVLGPDDLLCLFMINDPAVFMYKGDELDLRIVQKFLTAHSTYETLIRDRYDGLFRGIESGHKSLQDLSISPFDNSMKQLIQILKASAEEDMRNIEKACGDYFNSIAPYRYPLSSRTTVIASSDEAVE